ncbi:MAG: AraC family transcriptional regulator, partial [Rhodococcus erythropolis]|nr:AraC family transcriptional regulator [Rhodococcus erythropolis]
MQTSGLTVHKFWLSVHIPGYQGCMALLLDTSVLEPDQRTDAFVDAMGRASVPCAIHLEDPAGVSARMNVWNLGAASLFRSESTGMRLTRTPRHVRSASMPVLAIALQESGIGHLDQHDEQRRVPAGELLMTDLTSTYDFSWTGTGASQCLYVPMDRLGLPIDTVRDAATRPHHSNLYPLMIAHVRELFRSADQLETDPAAEQLGEASIELARALVVSIAHENPDASAPRSALTLTSVRRYI